MVKWYIIFIFATQNSYMHKGLYIIGLLLLLFVACTGDREVRALLEQAETANKLYKPLPSDTVFQEVVDYYDRHGDANERMKAYYLMGCIYCDRHEAPMALQWYLDAVEQADTLAADCDYLTLMKVYGQMAGIYHSQLMPMEEIESRRMFSKCAARIDSTYQVIRGIEKQLGAYQLMNDTAMILSLTDSVHDLYLQTGMPQAAASVFPSAIYIYLARHDYSKAKQLMDIFEQESGLFDADGNICKTREHYYQSKGLYYEGIGRLDSAEYFYRQLLPYGFKLDGYRGLISVYRTLHITDSVIHFIPHYEHAFNSYRQAFHAQAMHQVDAMYDYTRHQKIAHQKEIEANDARHSLYYIIIAIFLVAVLASTMFTKYRKRQAAQKAQLLDEAEMLAKSLEDSRREYLLFKTDKEQYERTLQEQIHNLESQNSSMKEKILEYKEDDSELMNSDIVKYFEDKALGKHGVEKVNRSYLSQLEKAFRKQLKNSYKRYKRCELSEFQLQVAMLTRLHFTTGDIALILGSSSSSISNTKARINNDMFGENTSDTLYNNLLSIKVFKIKE